MKVLASLLMMGFATSAAPITINFDGAVSTDITHAFAGLTFNAPLAGTGPVRTYASSLADTPGNLLGLSGQTNFFGFNQFNGAIDIVFDNPVSFVSIRSRFSIGTDAFLGIGGLPFMGVYNSATISAANRIGLVEWNLPGDPCLAGNFCVSAYDTLGFASASANIKAIRITGSLSTAGGVSRLALFDTLTYDRTNVAITYLVGDVAPGTSDTAPSFGDGVLNILDLVQVLFAVNNLPGFRPAACSDRFDAMDLYPADTVTTRGGDGVLDIRDLTLALFRANNLDLNRPVRPSRGGVCAGAAAARSADQGSQTGIRGQH